MTRIASHVVVTVPAALCLQAVQAGLGDERMRAAAHRLRPGKEYSGFVTSVKADRWLEITYAALDPLTGRRLHAFGWRVTYDFLPLDDGRTRVEVAIEYGRLAALGALGLLRAQAENDIAHRLMAILTLELGLHRGRPPELPAGDAAPAPHAYGAATRAL
jgi:hypothetical protein